MSGSDDSEQTIGYDYLVGVHSALCHGPIDKIIRIRADDKDTKIDESYGGRIVINMPKLFGGQPPEGEGGLKGDIDFLQGGPSQTANDYLTAKLPNGLVPAFKGVASLVFRQFYFGSSPYLKKMGFKAQRVFVSSRGQPQWQPTLAAVNTKFYRKSINIYMVLDISGFSTTPVTGPSSRWDLSRSAGIKGLEFLYGVFDDITIPVNLWVRPDDYVENKQGFKKYNIEKEDILEAIELLEDTTGWFTGTSNPALAAQGLNTYFPSTEKHSSGFLLVGHGSVNPDINTDNLRENVYWDQYYQNRGKYTKKNKNEVDAYGFVSWDTNTGNVNWIDNTPLDIIPRIESLNDISIASAIEKIVFKDTYSDLNPAHIIRECLTDPDWGMGYPTTDIDETSFLDAAVALKAEKLGLSLIWDRQISIEEFIQEIIKHIDGVLYVDRQTGKFKLKLIRKDYIVSTLPVLDEDNVEKVTDFTRPLVGELVNSVTIKYYSDETDSESSITVQDPALLDVQGTTINTSINYPGFTLKSVALKAAERDLRALSSPLITCSIIANREAASLNVGDAFVLTWPDFGIEQMIMRVASIAYGDDKNNRVKIKATQDVFTTPNLGFISEQETEWEDTVSNAVEIEESILFELPYYKNVKRLGEEIANEIFTEDPDTGYLGAAAKRPAGTPINAKVYVDEGSGYTQRGLLNFCPTATLGENIDYLTTTFDIENLSDLDSIAVNSWLQIDNELMAVVSVSEDSITVKRGILDTVPVPHLEDADIYFWDTIGIANPPLFISGDTINVKLATTTFSDELDIDIPTPQSLLFAQRAVRPYPPGKVKINDEYFPTDQQSGIVVSWVHRNRLQQTGGEILGFEDDGVTVEDGVTYTVQLLDQAETLLFEETGITSTSFEIPSGYIPLEEFCFVKIKAVRDGIDSFQSHLIKVTLPISGQDIGLVMDDDAAAPDGDDINFVLGD